MTDGQSGLNVHAGNAATPSGRIFISGGTGFVGGNLRQALAGRPLRLLVRDPAAYHSLDSPDLELATGDVTRAESLRGALDGCDTVIHLVAIIAESGGATFDGVIRQGTENVLAEAKAAGVHRFILMSAMGAQDNPAFPYLKAKWGAEQAVKAGGIPWTIFRPSVIFGPGDGFINVLADLVRGFPIIPVVGSGNSKFQPVAVGEVARAFVRAVDDPDTAGEIYELGGPEILTYETMLDTIAAKLGKRKRKIHVPVGLMKPVVALSKPLPKALRPPVTEEQLKMLALDNCTDHSATSELIGRQPTRLQDGIDYILRRR
ncbi:MAG: complex I NDUFA9 subunit family protein [Thermomicrobiales bacterium]